MYSTIAEGKIPAYAGMTTFRFTLPINKNAAPYLLLARHSGYQVTLMYF